MANAKLADRVDAIYKNSTQLANARDYLNMLAASEGTASRGDRGYNVMFRGDLVNDYSRHPNMVHTYIDKNGKQGKSTAAGRYQFLYKTYEEMAKKLGITDFSPESQDKVAIALMLEKGVDFDDGADFGANLRKINNVWTSLAGSSLGAQYHSTRSFQQNLDAFNQSRASRGMNPVTSAWNNTAYQTSPASLTSGMAQADAQRAMAQANSYLESLGLPKGGFLGQAMADINKKVYAEPGAIPFQMYSGNRFTVSSNPYLTPENLASMNARLRSTDPNVQYGVSMFGDGFHPTVAATMPNGSVGVGTDVPTTLSVAPALSDGGVPVEDATRARQAVTPATAQPAPVVAPTTAPAQQSTPQPLPTAVPQTPVSGASNGGASTPQASPAGASQPVVYPNSDAYHTGETTSGGMVRYNPATGDVEVAKPFATMYPPGSTQPIVTRYPAPIPNVTGVSSVFDGMDALKSTGTPASPTTYSVNNVASVFDGMDALKNTGTMSAPAPVVPMFGTPTQNSAPAVVPQATPQPQSQPQMFIPDLSPTIVPANNQSTSNGTSVGAWVIPTSSSRGSIVPQFQNTGVDALRDLLDQTVIRQRDLPS